VDQACVGGTLEIGPVSEQKGGAKIVLLPPRVHDELKAWQEASLWRKPTDMIFPGAARGIPVSAATITHALPSTILMLNAAAKKEGLPAAIETKGRNLVVHSFRHTYVSRLRRLVPEGVLRSLTGHHSEAMTNRYDHPDVRELVAELEPAREAVKGLLG
jgi:integrase